MVLWGKLTLVEHVLVLLAFGSSSGHVVHLVHETAAALLLVGAVAVSLCVVPCLV